MGYEEDIEDLLLGMGFRNSSYKVLFMGHLGYKVKYDKGCNTVRAKILGSGQLCIPPRESSHGSNADSF